ncbi:MAG: elongation factor P, partial [Verrucomicrobia bacterium 21-51-4]
KGRIIQYQGFPHVVLDTMQRTPGRRMGFVQATLRNLRTGSSTTVKFLSSDFIEFCSTQNRSLEYSYVDGDGHHFMDPETYEDIILPTKVVEEQLKFLVPNQSYDVLFVEEKAAQINLPGSVKLKVMHAPEGVKGDSANAPTITAETETGLTVQVPLFVKTGESILVSTNDGSYMGRA